MARYSPPSDLTWSATSGRGSVARTIAPSDPAVPIAASPATPAPATSTLAGGTLPAAVTCPVKNRPNACAASITARYPAMFAIDDNTSSDCAREIRGTASIAIAVIGRAANASTSSGSSAGLIRLITVAPSRSRSSSVSLGALTWKTMSAAHAASAGPTLAPAATYASSANDDNAPAPDSTSTSYPSLTNCSTVFGVAAT